MKELSFYGTDDLEWHLRDDVSVWLVPQTDEEIDESMVLTGACNDLVIKEENALFPQPDQFRSPLVLTCQVDTFEYGYYELYLEAPQIFLQDPEANVPERVFIKLH